VLYSFLVRTDFTSGGAWRQLSEEAQRENPDGFRANVELVSDPEFDGVTWEAVKAAVPANSVAVIFIVDSTALTSPDNPILVVGLLGSEPPFRCIPSELWNVDNNLNIANMSWEDFASALDENGVFRGFGLSLLVRSNVQAR
jgi:hypothetical protein